MLTREQKREIIKRLAEKLKESKGVVFGSFQGLKTSDSQAVRSNLRKEGADYEVVKINLLKRALRQAGLDDSQITYNLPLAVSYSTQDEVAPARILSDFAKKNEAFKILGGLLDKNLIDANGVRQLAALPTKQELLGQLVGVAAGPMRGFVSVLSGNLRKLVYAITAIRDKQQA